MTRANYTHIELVLDRSGSMSTIASDVKGGFKTFINKQKEVPGHATLGSVRFDERIERVLDMVPLASVSDELVLDPRGCTALYDALGKTVVELGNRLSGMREEDRPDRVIILVLTDGCENSSREWNALKLKALIDQQQNIYKWTFVFIGSNQDAMLSAAQIGIHTVNAMTMTNNAGGVSAAFNTLSSNVSAYRCCSTSDAGRYASGTIRFIRPEDIDAQKVADGTATST